MDHLRSKLLHLGPKPQCIANCKSWDEHCRALSKAAGLPDLIKEHGVELVRALRKNGKFKGVYRDLFPETSTELDRKYNQSPLGVKTGSTEQATYPGFWYDAWGVSYAGQQYPAAHPIAHWYPPPGHFQTMPHQFPNVASQGQACNATAPDQFQRSGPAMPPAAHNQGDAQNSSSKATAPDPDVHRSSVQECREGRSASRLPCGLRTCGYYKLRSGSLRTATAAS